MTETTDPASEDKPRTYADDVADAERAADNKDEAHSIISRAARVVVVPENGIGQALMDAETGDVLVIQYTENSHAGRLP